LNELIQHVTTFSLSLSLNMTRTYRQTERQKRFMDVSPLVSK